MKLIHQANVRRYLLDLARTNRPHNQFTRVSRETLEELNNTVRRWCQNRVHSSPSRKTL
jgi:hypothetical protein